MTSLTWSLRAAANRIPDKLYFKIGEVARLTGVEPYVLRYWESEFSTIQPVKLRNQRRYRKRDIEAILEIRRLLYEERFTIAGARKRLKEEKKEERGRRLDAPASGEVAIEDPEARKLVDHLKKELESIREMLQ